MLKIDNVVLPSVDQWEAVIRGMRNPKNSWDRQDSGWKNGYSIKPEELDAIKNFTNPAIDICEDARDGEYHYILGPNDLQLMQSLIYGGPTHRKFMRMIPVFLDITAPLYWWKEFDTYKIGTVANSCSTMHKIHAKPFTMDDFSDEDLLDDYTEKDGFNFDENEWHAADILAATVAALNFYRDKFNNTKDQKYWRQMIQLLPTSYNQRRTVMLNYEVLAGIYPMRKNHKLTEWHTFCKWIESLPYSELITGEYKETYNE